MAETKTSPKKTAKKATKKVAKKAVKKTPKKKGKKVKVTWNPNEKLTLSEEMFCLYYVKIEETRRNAVRSYDAAYDKKLEEKPTDDAVYELVPSDVEGAPPERKLVQASSYDRCYQVCGVEGHKLLKKPKINQRIIQILNEMMTDEFVDAELVKVISQDADLRPKVAGIAEYNKIKKRTTNSTVEHTHAFKKYEDMGDEELEKAINNGEKFFKKA